MDTNQQQQAENVENFKSPANSTLHEYPMEHSDLAGFAGTNKKVIIAHS
jgi:hypothetical protein